MLTSIAEFHMHGIYLSEGEKEIPPRPLRDPRRSRTHIESLAFAPFAFHEELDDLMHMLVCTIEIQSLVFLVLDFFDILPSILKYLLEKATNMKILAIIMDGLDPGEPACANAVFAEHGRSPCFYRDIRDRCSAIGVEH